MDEFLELLRSVEVEYDLPSAIREEAINTTGGGFGSSSSAEGPSAGYDKLLRPNNPFKRRPPQKTFDPASPIKNPRSGIKGVKGF